MVRDLTVPKQKSISVLVAEIETALEGLAKGKKILMARWHGLQSICEHPEIEKGNTWGRWPYKKCKICKKEW